MTNDIFRIDDPYAFLTKDLLEQEYIKEGLTDKQIAKKYGVGSKVTIWRRRKFFGIGNICPSKTNSNASKNRVFQISKEDAVRWSGEGLTHTEIAKIIGCSRLVVFRRFKELGMVQKEIHAKHKLRWHTELTDFQNRFLIGTLLGDGSVTSWGMFQCSHSKKQEEYARFKCQILLSVLAPEFKLNYGLCKAEKEGKLHETVYLRSMGNKFLRNLYNRFYDNKIKFFPYDFLRKSPFDVFSLAVWYMDDGGLMGRSACLFTFGFGLKGTDEALSFLYERFGIKGTRYQDNGKDRNPEYSFYIHLPVEQSDKFFSLIAPYIHPSMAYKLPESFRKQAGSLLPQNDLAR